MKGTKELIDTLRKDYPLSDKYLDDDIYWENYKNSFIAAIINLSLAVKNVEREFKKAFRIN